jgi:hypothetical protein
VLVDPVNSLVELVLQTLSSIIAGKILATLIRAEEGEN